MFGRIYHFLLAVAGVLGVATVLAGAGYLPQTGPVPLRFRALNPSVAEQAGPPAPPPMPAPLCLPVLPMPSEPPGTSRTPPEKEFVPVAVTNGPPLEYNAREPAAGPPAVPAPDAILVSPQMLIKYFAASTNASTNAGGMEAVTPFGFTPPTATPQTPMPPPGKPSYSIPP